MPPTDPGANVIPDNDPQLLVWGVLGTLAVVALLGVAWFVSKTYERFWDDDERPR